MIRGESLFLILFLISGCGLQQREIELKKKEAALQKKEQELIIREETILLKEKELLKLKEPSDAGLSDTDLVYDTRLTGNWSVRMECTETNCPGSAVGDTKSETWNFSYKDNRLIVQAMSHNKLIRTYTGKYTGSSIKLNAHVADQVSSGATQMLVELTWKNKSSMEGMRQIIRENNCKTIYLLKLSKKP